MLTFFLLNTYPGIRLQKENFTYQKWVTTHSDDILREISFCVYNCGVRQQYFGVLKLSVQVDQEDMQM